MFSRSLQHFDAILQHLAIWEQRLRRSVGVCWKGELMLHGLESSCFAKPVQLSPLLAFHVLTNLSYPGLQNGGPYRAGEVTLS